MWESIKTKLKIGDKKKKIGKKVRKGFFRVVFLKKNILFMFVSFIPILFLY